MSSLQHAHISHTDWGVTDYREALQKQLKYLSLRKEQRIPDTLVFTEHNPVYTIGRRLGSQSNLVANPDFLKKYGIDVVETNRGGDITYHGPGQIVGYIFIDLSDKKDLHALLRNVEDMIIRALHRFELKAMRRENMTGVWIDNRKIAAIGMSARHWISFHGFALNVSPCLDHFSGIIPCGITNGSVTSMDMECKRTVSLTEVKSILLEEFVRMIKELS